MASSNPLALIEKLTGRENYSTWRFAVKTYLQHEELWECIENPNKEPFDTKKDTKAKSKIILLVDSINYVHIQEAKTAKEVWENLSRAFDDSGLTRRVGLLRDLCTTTLSGCQNIDEYVSKIMSTAHKLRNIGFQVDDEWLGTLLLSGLPEHYKPMILAIESSGMKISADSVKSKLLQEVKSENNNSAFTSGHGSQIKNVKKKFNKGPRCFQCNKYGHKSTECRSKPKEKVAKSNSSYAAAFIIPFKNNSSEWYIDSGATMHMTRHQNLLQNENSPPIKQIKVANNKTLSVSSSGNVTLNTLNGENRSNVILFTNVLYVPELAVNLISVHQITENGGQVKFDSKGCTILNRQNVIVATATKVNNMYRLNMNTDNAYMSDVKRDDIFLWHQRMGHLNLDTLKKLKENSEGFTLSDKQVNNITCITCKEGKQTRMPFKSQGSHSSRLLELVHSDLCGPMETQSLGGGKYFLTFLDDYSKKVFVYILNNKTEVLSKFKEFKTEVENQTECKLKCIRTDNGLEYVNKPFSDFLKNAGIRHQTSTPYTPEQNGAAERLNRTLVERAKCMILNAGLVKFFWAEAIKTAAYIINRSPTRSLLFKTPEEVWTGHKPNISNMKVFGCEAMVHLPKEKRKKWDPKAQKMIFIGYCENTKGYRFILPNTRTIIKSRDAVFLECTVKRNYVTMELSETENKTLDIHCKSNEESLMSNESNEKNRDESCYSDSSYNTVNNNSDLDEYLPEIKIDTPPRSNITLRPRNKNKEQTYLCYDERLVPEQVPETYKEAIRCVNAEKWKKAIEEELEAHERNGTWILVNKPENTNIIGCKWVFRVKDQPTGPRFKSRLCAKGYAQAAGIDYKETYSPTVRYDSIRVLLSLAAQNGYEILQLDIKTAFLYGELKENIYMYPPEGLTYEPNKVCKLIKSLYGLKQAPRCWNTTFNSVLQKFGFINSKADQCVYVANIKGTKCYLCIYVDDGLLFSKSKFVLQSVTNDLKTIFDMTICPPGNFVGMEIQVFEKYIFIHQSKYIKQLLNKFNMDNANPNSVPVDPHSKLEKSENQPDKHLPYREAVGSLMHVAIVSRPDIMFAVSLVSRFLNCYDESHWTAVKKILKYLKDTINFGLCYQSVKSPELVGYSDADYANDITTRRSTTGYIFIKCGAAVTWCSQRQHTVALSTTEAEFMAACSATKEAIWIKQLLCDLGEFKQQLVVINIDNQSAISVIKNINFHKRCKHIDTKYHFIKEKYYGRVIDLKYVSTCNQLADSLTKALPRDKFQYMRVKIGMLSIDMLCNL